MLITLAKWSINTDYIVTIGWLYDDIKLVAAKVQLCTSSMKGSQATGISDELYIDKEDDVESFRNIMDKVQIKNLNSLICEYHIDVTKDVNRDMYK